MRKPLRPVSTRQAPPASRATPAPIKSNRLRLMRGAGADGDGPAAATDSADSMMEPEPDTAPVLPAGRSGGSAPAQRETHCASRGEQEQGPARSPNCNRPTCGPAPVETSVATSRDAKRPQPAYAAAQRKRLSND